MTGAAFHALVDAAPLWAIGAVVGVGFTALYLGYAGLSRQGPGVKGQAPGTQALSLIAVLATRAPSALAISISSADSASLSRLQLTWVAP